MIDKDLIHLSNKNEESYLEKDYHFLGEKLSFIGVDIENITRKAQNFSLSLPSWGVAAGGTRFARFPLAGEPRNIFEKIIDCSVIHQLCCITPKISLHIPWDKVDNLSELKDMISSYKMSVDSINSNTFQEHNYKFGSLSHTDSSIREKAIAHNIECIEIGSALNAKSLTVWIGDGTNFPGQQNFNKSFDRYLNSMKTIYTRLPQDWKIFIEHKCFEPSFYSTIIQDWGSNYLATQELGDKALSLVDLGHHAPNVNIEMIVARLLHCKKLGGFHFNDSKYGDDDLDSGSINPYQLFLIFNELIQAEYDFPNHFNITYMLDQSHNITDPIESLITSAIEVQRAYIQALLVERSLLEEYQKNNDVMMAYQTLKKAYLMDITPILSMARFRNKGAINPISVYRKSNYRKSTIEKRYYNNMISTGIV